jgi:hypothetical protein
MANFPMAALIMLTSVGIPLWMVLNNLTGGLTSPTRGRTTVPRQN